MTKGYNKMYILSNQAAVWKMVVLKRSQQNGMEYVELDYGIRPSVVEALWSTDFPYKEGKKKKKEVYVLKIFLPSIPVSLSS